MTTGKILKSIMTAQNKTNGSQEIQTRPEKISTLILGPQHYSKKHCSQTTTQQNLFTRRNE